MEADVPANARVLHRLGRLDPAVVNQEDDQGVVAQALLSGGATVYRMLALVVLMIGIAAAFLFSGPDSDAVFERIGSMVSRPIFSPGPPWRPSVVIPSVKPALE